MRGRCMVPFFGGKFGAVCVPVENVILRRDFISFYLDMKVFISVIFPDIQVILFPGLVDGQINIFGSGDMNNLVMADGD